jgi:hypothetical protein
MANVGLMNNSFDSYAPIGHIGQDQRGKRLGRRNV